MTLAAALAVALPAWGSAPTAGAACDARAAEQTEGRLDLLERRVERLETNAAADGAPALTAARAEARAARESLLLCDAALQGRKRVVTSEIAVSPPIASHRPARHARKAKRRVAMRRVDTPRATGCPPARSSPCRDQGEGWWHGFFAGLKRAVTVRQTPVEPYDFLSTR